MNITKKTCIRENFFRIFIDTRSNGVLYAGNNLFFYGLGAIFLFLFLILFFFIDIIAKEEDYINLFGRYGAILILYGFITTLSSFGLNARNDSLKIRKEQAKKHKDKLLGQIQMFRDIRLISKTHVYTFYMEVCRSYKRIISIYEKIQKDEDKEFKQKFIKLEIFLVILGTLIWAYGDLFVQLFR